MQRDEGHIRTLGAQDRHQIGSHVEAENLMSQPLERLLRVRAGTQ